MDIIRLIQQVLGQHGEARAIILLGSKDAFFSPVRPEDVLLVNTQSIWEMDSMQNHLSVLASECATLNLVPRKF